MHSIGNPIFLKATGLTSKQTNRLTLFSLVQGDRLSNLFEIIGNALRIAKQQKLEQENNSNNNNDNNTKGSSKQSSSSTSNVVATTSCNISSSNVFVKKNYDNTTTLPCILFPSNCSLENNHPNSFYMTVSVNIFSFHVLHI